MRAGKIAPNAGLECVTLGSPARPGQPWHCPVARRSVLWVRAAARGVIWPAWCSRPTRGGRAVCAD